MFQMFNNVRIEKLRLFGLRNADNVHNVETVMGAGLSEIFVDVDLGRD